MAAISFDQPSSGTVTSASNALNVTNNGTGGALRCVSNKMDIANATIFANNNSGFGIYGESKGGQPGIQGQSATGHGIVGESKGGNAGLVGISNTGSGVIAKGAANGLLAETSNGVGVFAQSSNGIGVSAKGGKLAGKFEGNVEVTGDIRLVNADCAEEFEVNTPVEPGTVMVVDNKDSLKPSDISYDKRVAGIISGAGGYRPGIVLNKQEGVVSTRTRAAVALMGKVYCKVDATHSPIDMGDLLTTSPTIGHAMKAGDPFKAFGAVIGKALEPLKHGKGMIPVLVALQ